MDTFRCPLCKTDVKIGEFGKMSSGANPYEYRLANKRFHMLQHKTIKKLKHKISIVNNKLKELKEEISIELSVFSDDT